MFGKKINYLTELKYKQNNAGHVKHDPQNLRSNKMN